jgi:hypothetical protein
MSIESWEDDNRTSSRSRQQDSKITESKKMYALSNDNKMLTKFKN